MAETTETVTMLKDVASRIREMREITGYSADEMARWTGVTPKDYRRYEAGSEDMPFTFIHKCAKLFGVELTDLLEGRSAHLTSYTVTRRGGGTLTAREPGIEIKGLAPLFKDKIAEPYWVTYTFDPEQQDKPIHTITHDGQEFDMISSGSLKVQVGEQTEVLREGDTIYYNSSEPHGMIAVDGQDCTFLAVVLAGEHRDDTDAYYETITPAEHEESLIYEQFVDTVEDENGALQSIRFIDEDDFNFAFDIVDGLAKTKPDKLAMLHVDAGKNVRRFTFEDMSRMSSRAANYLRSMGIKRGDRVMLVLRRNYQFWVAILALHKLGAIAIPATDQLLEKDFEYRFNAAGVCAVICTADSHAAEEAEKAMAKCPTVKLKFMANGCRGDWHDFDREMEIYRGNFVREEDAPSGSDPCLALFTSGTTGYPKLAVHSYKYALGHFITAKYWHRVDPNGIHFTISETGWGKALWGKLYGQWMCECAVFVYDFERFAAKDILEMLETHKITTFCAPPTMYRFIILEDLSKYDLSSIKHATTAGEALNPEVFHKFKKLTGLSITEGFGQTETTLTIANLVGMTPKVGSMGKPSPLYKVDIYDREGKPVGVGETGEIVIHTDEGAPCGLFSGYYNDEQSTENAWHDGVYHTGDTAWRDEDGFFWYVGRVDDLIKSSGYRIGPFEIESVLMELPYVLECGVSPAPDPIRGQVVKASIVLVDGTEPSEDLKKEIQEYVKKRTAPYKYPRQVVFLKELPKTISGKIQRHLL